MPKKGLKNDNLCPNMAKNPFELPEKCVKNDTFFAFSGSSKGNLAKKL